VADDLFTAAGDAVAEVRAPLAARMRPSRLSDVVGQPHLLTPGSPLLRLAQPQEGPVQAVSVVLYGPPGTGKTTLAWLLARAGGREFVELSAVSAGVADVRRVIDDARRRLGTGSPGTLLFVDEVHRFSRVQQDALLPAVERGWVTLVAATTENPAFSLIGPLLSRSVVLRLEPLGTADLRTLLDRALTAEQGLAGTVRADPAALDRLAQLADGDARWALTALEAAAGAALAAGGDAIGPDQVAEAVQRAQLRYDQAGDEHYNIASALIKSVRGSDADAALHYLGRMVAAGADLRFIARRLVILAAEDVGLADPNALPAAVAAADAVAMLGLPEARLPLAQAVIQLSLAPKSNTVICAIDAAIADVEAGRSSGVPAHLRDRHAGGDGAYRYPHDLPPGVAAQQYAPDALVSARYLQFGERGAEAQLGERYRRIRTLLDEQQRPGRGEPLG
jgi:putative ATPase